MGCVIDDGGEVLLWSALLVAEGGTSEDTIDDSELMLELEVELEIAGPTSLADVGALLEGSNSRVEASDWLALVADAASSLSATEDKSNSSLMAIAALVMTLDVQVGDAEIGNGSGVEGICGIDLGVDVEGDCEAVADVTANAEGAPVDWATVGSDSGIFGNTGIINGSVEFEKMPSELNSRSFGRLNPSSKPCRDMAEPVLSNGKDTF